MSRDLPLLGIGGAGFSPASLSGLKLWLKADALSLNDNDPVGTWSDSSGNGNDGTQSTAANKPTFKTNTVNAKPVVGFDGVNDYLSLLNAFSALTAAEIFIVLRRVLDPPSVTTRTGLWTFGSDANNTHYPYTDGIVYDQFGTTTRKISGDPATDLAAAFRLYNVVSQAGEWTSRINGVQHYTTATNTVGFTTTPNLGAGIGGASYFLDGDVAEVLLYDSVLSAGNRASVENYLNGKYALY